MGSGRRNLNYLTDIEVQAAEGGVRVFYVVQASHAYDHFEFRGLDHFKESDVRVLLGLGEGVDADES